MTVMGRLKFFRQTSTWISLMYVSVPKTTSYSIVGYEGNHIKSQQMKIYIYVYVLITWIIIIISVNYGNLIDYPLQCSYEWKTPERKRKNRKPIARDVMSRFRKVQFFLAFTEYWKLLFVHHVGQLHTQWSVGEGKKGENPNSKNLTQKIFFYFI